jgi:hypothetical protein
MPALQSSASVKDGRGCTTATSVKQSDELINGGHDDVHARDVVRVKVVDVAPRGGDAVVGLR